MWLAQATKVRDEALRLMRERFSKDLDDVRQFVGCNAPNAFTLQVEYATKLMADYLAESERMFELISKLARDGLLEPDRIGGTESDTSGGHTTGNR